MRAEVTGGRAVRLGLVLDSFEQPRWVVQSFEEAIREKVLTVVCLGIVGEAGRDALVNAPTAPEKESLALRLYHALDRAKFHPETTPWDLDDIRPALGDAAPLHLSATTAASDDGKSAGALLSHELDLILNLSTRLGSSHLAGAAKFGVASYILGGIPGTRHHSIGIREVLSGEPVISVRLAVVGPTGESMYPPVETVTNTHIFSAGRSRALAARHAVALLARLARRISMHADASPPPSRVPGPPPESHAAATDVASAGVGASLLRLGARYLLYISGVRRTRDQWLLAYNRGTPEDGVAVVPELELSRYRTIDPPADRFWADPFPMRVDDRDYLLIEELLFSDDVGHLSVLELGPDGPLGDPVTVLKKPYHLSYPFVFRHEGEWYLLPETALEGRLELYRAVRAPYEWVLDRVLMEGTMLMDATLQEIDGRWWMFACEARDKLQPWVDLLLFYADSPFGPWTPHPQSPVVSDVRCARPAGRLFRRDGHLLRPAQDCSRTYGGAISLRRIVTLSTTEYEEVEETYLAGGAARGVSGPHTLNREGALSVIDLKRPTRR